MSVIDRMLVISFRWAGTTGLNMRTVNSKMQLLSKRRKEAELHHERTKSEILKLQGCRLTHNAIPTEYFILHYHALF